MVLLLQVVLLLVFGNLAGWYSYFFGTIIRHTRVSSINLDFTVLYDTVGMLHSARRPPANFSLGLCSQLLKPISVALTCALFTGSHDFKCQICSIRIRVGKSTSNLVFEWLKSVKDFFVYTRFEKSPFFADKINTV